MSAASSGGGTEGSRIWAGWGSSAGTGAWRRRACSSCWLTSCTDASVALASFASLSLVPGKKDKQFA